MSNNNRKKIRIDKAIRNRGLRPSREKAKREIMAGNVYVEGQLVDKPGTRIYTDNEIEVRGKQRYVSRGGRKLQHALDIFSVDVQGLRAVDIGASTGGFTQCLLESGAEKVWAVDVGKGQLAWKLRQDSRVNVLEGLNARYLSLEDIGKLAHVVTIDVSFISLDLILPSASELLLSGGDLISLVKPQFEAGKDQVEDGGLVSDPEIHEEVLRDKIASGEANGLAPIAATHSPITGKASKNIEYFLHFTKEGDAAPLDIPKVVSEAHDKLC